MSTRFDRIFIDQEAVESDLALRVRELFPADKIQIVETRPFGEAEGTLSAQQFARSKKNLYLTNFKGHFFKRCPGARPGLTCCNYFVLNLGLQCDMDCSYCYLQSFINTPVMTVYTNVDQALQELKSLANPQTPLRVGTGEVIDSLSLDDLTLYSHKLIPFFRNYPNWRLEFKTKSDKVDQFLDLEHAGNVVTSWSINPQNVIAKEEHRTASLAARLAAAEKCAQKNFLISFHIDPVIWHPGWQDSYAALVDEITKRFSPNDMPYLSLGALRFQPEQRHMMRERFGMKSLVTSAEMFPNKDGKLRYDAHVRTEMFDFIISRFKAHSPNWNIFLCMESPETWLGTFSQMPKHMSGLSDLFDHRPVREFRHSSRNC